MHLVVCIKQVPDFCVNSRRFSDEHGTVRNSVRWAGFIS